MEEFLNNQDGNETVISLKNLTIDIPLDEGLLTPVRGVSFDLKANETLGLVGESGCGKSLTAKAILGINGSKCKSGGSIEMSKDGRIINLLDSSTVSVKEMRDIRGKIISMIFQEPMSAFSPLFTIGHQLSEAVKLHITRDKRVAKDIVVKMLKRVGIANPEERYAQHPHEFSGGMLQRALIAMALVCSPKMLIADEPTTALDVTIQAQILTLMKELQKEYGMAILYITHDLGTVAKMCDNVAVMYLGRIVEYASVYEIFANPLHPYTLGLMGSVYKIRGAKKRLASIPGTVPLAMNLEDKCSFYDRCSFSDDIKCLTREPSLMEVSKDHFVSCYNVDKILNRQDASNE